MSECEAKSKIASPSTSSLSQWLCSVKIAVKSFGDNPNRMIDIVFGNEAADLDSCVCALAYGGYLARKLGDESYVIPMININREDFLRSEVEWLLSLAGVSMTVRLSLSFLVACLRCSVSTS